MSSGFMLRRVEPEVPRRCPRTARAKPRVEGASSRALGVQPRCAKRASGWGISHPDGGTYTALKARSIRQPGATPRELRPPNPPRPERAQPEDAHRKGRACHNTSPALPGSIPLGFVPRTHPSGGAPSLALPLRQTSVALSLGKLRPANGPEQNPPHPESTLLPRTCRPCATAPADAEPLDRGVSSRLGRVQPPTAQEHMAASRHGFHASRLTVRLPFGSTLLLRSWQGLVSSLFQGAQKYLTRERVKLPPTRKPQQDLLLP